MDKGEKRLRITNEKLEYLPPTFGKEKKKEEKTKTVLWYRQNRKNIQRKHTWLGVMNSILVSRILEYILKRFRDVEYDSMCST